MKRLAIILVSAFMIFGLSLGSLAAVQDTGTPAAGAQPCASPVASPVASSPMASPVSATPTASPTADEPCATPQAGGSSEVVVVELVDIAFVQNEIRIPANTDVTFQIINKGGMQHDLKIDDTEAYSGMLSGGQEAELVVNLPAGEYQFYCTIPGHKESGMVGTLIVE